VKKKKIWILNGQLTECTVKSVSKCVTWWFLT
jgi:hypothetical protein